ncbi:MAG: hypothetical protein HQ539_01485 [Parcubacteria group bacterium]|nr:hypothetical protein [Parcubacteria group bacterium]
MFVSSKTIKKVSFLSSVLLLSFLLGFLFFSDGLKTDRVIAESSDNVSGFAWSETIGWISMNCRNQELQGPRCKNSGYGVHIEDNGSFTGYAWNENIGWINFAPAGPYPQNPQQSVQVDVETGVLSGWARALSYGGGWDGWISMSGTSPNYGVVINRDTGDFSGWAWGSVVVGWIHFADTRYKTETSFSFNNDPTVSNLSVNQGDYCVLAFRPTFSWVFDDEDGDPQDAYQVQIDDDLQIWANPLIDSCEPASGTCASGNVAQSYSPASPSSFNYKTTYYWRVKVWDNRGGESEWVSGQFTTPDHKYPGPDFEWTPQRPSDGELAQYCSTAQGVCVSDVSDCYAVGGGQISCSGSSFTWTFPPGTEFSTSTNVNSENPTAKINESGWQDILLNIDDGVGSCTASKSIRISSPLPKWQEVAPD